MGEKVCEVYPTAVHNSSPMPILAPRPSSSPSHRPICVRKAHVHAFAAYSITPLQLSKNPTPPPDGHPRPLRAFAPLYPEYPEYPTRGIPSAGAPRYGETAHLSRQPSPPTHPATSQVARRPRARPSFASFVALPLPLPYTSVLFDSTPPFRARGGDRPGGGYLSTGGRGRQASSFKCGWARGAWAGGVVRAGVRRFRDAGGGLEASEREPNKRQRGVRRSSLIGIANSMRCVDGRRGCVRRRRRRRRRSMYARRLPRRPPTAFWDASYAVRSRPLP
ncbi:hypothetical protein OF83DRAFT_22571 [Amylostereum chailletii]|nr:hypothetical protein OF83DRAFT_22571 [Amylostereum chailletii]